MDGRQATPVSAYYFDCRRYVRPGDIITYCMGGKDTENVKGQGKVLRVYEQFVVLAGRYTNITVNRWSITAFNNHAMQGGCFKNFEPIERRIN